VQIEIERLGRKIDLKKNWEKEPVYVLADPEKIGQVVMNICLNSVQAISEGGQITVSMEKGERKNAGYVCFSVSDSGCGIDQEKISKIFDPFFTTKENGTGLASLL
jgi:signal transduction histidine kinase